MENKNQVQEPKKTKKKVPRCKCKLEDGKKCKKKLTVVDLCIVCKCGKSFCPKHRTPEAHKCKISEIIARKNREVQLDKVLGGGSFKQIEVI
jgi:hypothetical protein